MSVLSDVRILEKIYEKKIIIDPFVFDNVQPSSIDLTLDCDIKIPKINIEHDINVFDKNLEEYFDNKMLDQYVLKPGDLIIAQIKETIKLTKMFNANILNRNSLIKLGINVSLSSYINPGYCGKLPIVISNMGKFNIKLVPCMRICQLVIYDVFPEPENDYSTKSDSKYFGEKDISLSKIYQDVEFREYLEKYNKNHNDKIDNDSLTNFLSERIKSKAKSIIGDLTSEEKVKLGLI